MKKIDTLFIIIVLLMVTPLLYAQEQDDSRYLEGAVPEEQGKVVFSRDFNIPGMSKDEIMQRTEAWMDGLMKQNKNNSRIVFTDADAGNIVGNADHYIVFSSSALSLDRTRMLFLLSATAKPENLNLEVSRIRYIYHEGGKETSYTAEEMITDEYALNKTHTKLSRGYAKWRRKTVDYVDSIFIGAVNMLKATDNDARNEQELRNNNQTTIVIANNQIPATSQQPTAAQPKPTEEAKTVEVTKPVGDAKSVVEAKPAVEAAPVIETKPEVETKPATMVTPASAPVPEGYSETDVSALSSELIVAGNGRLVVAIGTDIYNMTTFTANAGGSLGKQNDKTVVYTIFSTEQDVSALKKADSYSVRFYPNGAERPSIILECKALPSQTTIEGMPQIFSGEVQRAFVK